MISDVLWVEKYRPSKLEELALSEANRNLLEGYIEAGEIPHLLLSGPPGVGKTTAAKILIDNLDCKALVLNASSERGIDIMRNRVGTFIRGMFGAKWNIVFLDEADALTTDAQTALRNMFETYANRSRFILSANYTYRIISPLQSRCVTVEMAEVPVKERFRILNTILEAEEIRAEPGDVFSYTDAHTDLRRMIMAAQKAWMVGGVANFGSLPPFRDEVVDAKHVLGLIAKGAWADLRKASKTPGFNHQRILTDLFWVVPDDHPQAARWRWILGKAVHESTWTPDHVVHFLGTAAELMEV